MTVVRVDLDPDALTLTIVAEFDELAEQVWQVWADPESSSNGGGHGAFPRRWSTTTSHPEAASRTS